MSVSLPTTGVYYLRSTSSPGGVNNEKLHTTFKIYCKFFAFDKNLQTNKKKNTINKIHIFDGYST